jgi:hypothetical protein
MTRRLRQTTLIATTVFVAMLMFMPTAVEYGLILAGITARGID